MLRTTAAPFASLFLCATSLSHAGLYVGAGVGPDFIDFQQHAHVVSVNLQHPNQGFNVLDKTHLSGTGVFGTLFGGFEGRYNKAYLAVEINGNISSSGFKSTNAEAIHQSFAEAKYKIKNGLGVSAIPGLLLYPDFLFYGRAGLVNSHIKIRTDDKSLQDVSTRHNGFRWGLGGRQNINERLAVRMEYSQIDYAGVRMYTFDPGGSVAKTTKVTPHQQLVEFGIVYRFQPTPHGYEK